MRHFKISQCNSSTSMANSNEWWVDSSLLQLNSSVCKYFADWSQKSSLSVNREPIRNKSHREVSYVAEPPRKTTTIAMSPNIWSNWSTLSISRTSSKMIRVSKLPIESSKTWHTPLKCQRATKINPATLQQTNWQSTQTTAHWVSKIAELKRRNSTKILTNWSKKMILSQKNTFHRIKISRRESAHSACQKLM